MPYSGSLSGSSRSRASSGTHTNTPELPAERRWRHCTTISTLVNFWRVRSTPIGRPEQSSRPSFHVQVSGLPLTRPAAEVRGAIASLELMIEAGGGDVDAKATLALTTYRVAARTSGLAWADGRFEPIFMRLREQAAALGRQAQVEKILRGIPD